MTPLVYVLNNGNLGKNAQIALATLDGLRDEFVPYLFAPQGVVVKEAQKMGIIAQSYSGAADFTLKLWLLLAASSELSFVASDWKHSYPALLLNFFYRRRMAHLHLIGEDADQKTEISKPGRLNKYDVTFVADSKTAREKLIAMGARNERIRVIENFLPERLITSTPRRSQFKTNGVTKITVVSRIEADKRIELLFDALEYESRLSSLEFKIYGTGSRLEVLKKRAAREFPNVSFEGLGKNIPQKLADSDLYLHLCPDQSSTLTILGALAADVPVLVPFVGDETIITDEVNGFCFEADNAESLARRLTDLSRKSFNLLNAVAKGGRYLLNIRFSAENGIQRFRRLLQESTDNDIHMTHGKLIL